ncbi:hypothetical protein L211DRAFT_766710, partial [Terfezia boudieri ATCC MYA-4762]
LPAWAPHPRLDPALIPAVQSAVNSITVSHRQAPTSGEIFDNPDAAFARLQDYAFVMGFAVVKTAGSITTGWVRYACIHHGQRRNYRDLQDIQLHNPDQELDGRPLRQRRTKTQAKECKWAVSVSYNLIQPGSPDRQWVLVVPIQDNNHIHTHEMVPNPFTYLIHQYRHKEFMEARSQAAIHREAGLSYNQSTQLLHRQGLEISRNGFYNTQRSSATQFLTTDDRICNLLEVLDKAGFH